MRAVKRWRYYCDFCHKAKMVKNTMVKHELGCTLNPARVCGICRLLENVQVPIEELKAALEADSVKIPVLRELAGNCPTCILAAIRQYNVGLHPEDTLSPEFEFKKEMESFWKDYNESQASTYAYG